MSNHNRIEELSDRVEDIENWIYGTDSDIVTLLENQKTLTNTINEIVDYMNKLFITNINRLVLTIEEDED
jgi:hypothetical protein